MFVWLKQRLTAAALTAASAIIVLELINPWGIFDFLLDCVLFVLIAAVGWANKK